MDGDLDPQTAASEHDEFVKILKENKVNVHYFDDLFVEA
jgi:arginine deiminase